MEDEPRLAQALAEIIRGEKHRVDTVQNGEDGLEYGLSGQYDIIVLDVMLPKLRGTEVVKRLRGAKITTPIIMLSALDEVMDRVKGLDCGADDYMTKPFAPQELLARVRALARRPSELLHEELGFGDLTLNLSTNILTCGERQVHLGYKEFETLRILMLAQDAITSKDTLIIRVWGSESSAEDNNVEAYISFLRKKFQYLGSETGIVAIRKMGYRLEEPCSLKE